MRRLKEDILKLRSDGKSYNEICRILGCSKGTVSFHCGKGVREKSKIRQATARFGFSRIISSKIERFSQKHSCNPRRSSSFTSDQILKSKIERFFRMGRTRKTPKKTIQYATPAFTKEDFIKKIGDTPVCYISGRSIDLFDRKSWSIDHIIPRSRGGDNSLANAGISNNIVNLSKSSMLIEEFLDMCKEVLEHNGYEVKKNIQAS